jgi:hypothetical protein
MDNTAVLPASFLERNVILVMIDKMLASYVQIPLKFYPADGLARVDTNHRMG